MSRDGREILKAGTAAEAEAILARANVDVVVAAFARPGLDGADLLHLMQERAPEVPTILLVESSSTATATDLLRHGAYDVLAMGADGEILGAAVARAG